MKITRIVGTADGIVREPQCFIEADFTPDETIIQNESARILFGEEDHPVLIQSGWELKKKDIYRFAIEGKAKIVKKMTIDGERTFVENAKDMLVGSSYEGTLKLDIRSDERILGLGQHEDGIANYRNCVQHLYQNNMQIPMPVFLSTGGYAIVLAAQCLMIYEEKENQITITFDAADQIDYYVIEDEDLRKLAKAVRRMTGKAVLLPKWAYGYVQSREKYRTQQELLDIAAEFQRRNIPVSCLVQDWQTWNRNMWGDKHLDKSRYPNLKEALDALHDQGIGFLFSIWPNINKGSEDNAEMVEAGKMYANLSTYDAFDEEARALYWKQCEREIFAAGTDGWWCDSSEPFTPDWGGVDKKTAEERYELAKGSLTKYMDARQGNSYALFHALGIHDNQRKSDNSKRVINLTRSGYPSIQKYGAILWSGDIMATWDVYKNQIVEGLQMAASGFPYWTLDIGAFFTGNQECWKRFSGVKEGIHPWFWNGLFEQGNADLGYRELYTRWLQYGTFLPIMRSHGTDTPREPWFYGEEGDLYYDTIVKYIRLRYHLVPYIYSLAWKVYKEDEMMMRSLVFDYPSDETAATCTDQYLFGDFLVCPVTEAMEYGPESTPLNKKQVRSVYLPEGIWYDYENKTMLTGKKTIEADAPVSHMPLYIRGGSIVPVEQKGAANLYEKQMTETLTVEIYGGADGSFVYYQDAGNGYEYQNGAYAAIPLHWSDADRKLAVGAVEGSYAYPQKIRILLYTQEGCMEASAVYEGEEIAIEIK
ncbi:MAG: DUF5110 domain-containing protein [Lachnospiraceae bacterium]|nr:DUF5110 domain-containing protein [Lachnospiraceae bacterium]